MFIELIGDLRWVTEIGRVDSLHEVLMLSAFQASPQRGAFTSDISHLFFMKKNPKPTIYFDPIFPNIDTTSFSGSPAEEFR